MKSKCIVYAIFALVLLQAYIGSTINAQRRWEKEHLSRLRRNKHENKALQDAYNHYGEECVQFMPLETVDSIDLLPEREALDSRAKEDRSRLKRKRSRCAIKRNKTFQSLRYRQSSLWSDAGGNVENEI